MSEHPSADVLRSLAAVAGVDPVVLERPETARYLEDLAAALARIPVRQGDASMTPFDPTWPEEAE